jgi:hypothetical protein
VSEEDRLRRENADLTLRLNRANEKMKKMSEALRVVEEMQRTLEEQQRRLKLLRF